MICKWPWLAQASRRRAYNRNCSENKTKIENISERADQNNNCHDLLGNVELKKTHSIRRNKMKYNNNKKQIIIIINGRNVIEIIEAGILDSWCVHNKDVL